MKISTGISLYSAAREGATITEVGVGASASTTSSADATLSLGFSTGDGAASNSTSSSDATGSLGFTIGNATSSTSTTTASATTGVRQWVPTDVTGCLWYLDADDLSAGNVTSWPGHGATFTEATNPPVYEATGYNSKPSVLFDGVNDIISAIGITTLANGNDAAWSHVWARQLVVAGASKTHWCSGHSTAAHTESIVEQSNATPLIRWTKTDDSTATANAGAVAADTSAHVVSAVASGTAISTWFDNVLDANGTAENLGQTTLDQMAYGASFKGTTKAGFANLRMRRAAAYSVALSTANRNICEAWCAL